MWSVRFFHSCQLTHCVICSQRYISPEIDEIHKFIKRRALESTVYAWFVQLYQTLVFNLFSIFGLIKMATQKFYVEILLIRIRPYKVTPQQIMIWTVWIWTWFGCEEHLGTTSFLCLAIKSSSWLTRKEGGRAATPPTCKEAWNAQNLESELNSRAALEGL